MLERKYNINMPEISVLMSTYNRENSINRSIKSILRQTYRNFEFIICDDGSTDNTFKCLKNWSKKDNRIKLLKNKHNCGLQISLNRCLKISKGKYIARMDDDDISVSNRFEVQLKFMESHPNIAFIGSNMKLFDGDKIYGKEIFSRYPSKLQLFKKDEFCHPSIFARSKILKKNGGYSIKGKYFRVEDYEFWLRLYTLGYQGANVQQFLLIYHLNIHSHKNKFYDYYNRFRLLCDYKKKLHIGVKGYIYIIVPLIKLLIPSFIRNKIYTIKYRLKEK